MDDNSTSDAPVAERRRRTTFAGHTGDDNAARAGLIDTNADVRSSALSALHRLGCLTLHELSAGADDPSSLVRRRVASIAAHREDADRLLLELLKDADQVVAEVAAFAAGERAVGGREVVDVLCDMAISHEDSLCRESAVAALGAIGDPAGLPAVLRACSDKATVRRRAVLALAAFDDPTASQRMRDLLADRDLQVRQAAEELLAIEAGEEF